jgi:xylan 1,4-beta-xylosidase
MKRLKKFGLLIVLITTFSATKAQTFSNTILSGFYHNPCVCKSGNAYIVNSSFAYYSDLPIFHSKDLLSRNQTGSALNRPEQLNIDGASVSGGLYAPSISYNKSLFYIVCTPANKPGNIVVT